MSRQPVQGRFGAVRLRLFHLPIAMGLLAVTWMILPHGGGGSFHCGPRPELTSAEVEAIRHEAEARRARYAAALDSLSGLATLEDNNLDTAVMARVHKKAARANCEAYLVVEGLAAGVKMMYSTTQLEGQVGNGGFNQYFFNTEGRLAAAAVAGYDLIGATERARVARRAVEMWKAESARPTASPRARTIEAFSESYEQTSLGSLDEEFYKLRDDVESLRVRYARAHPDEFVGW